MEEPTLKHVDTKLDKDKEDKEAREAKKSEILAKKTLNLIAILLKQRGRIDLYQRLSCRQIARCLGTERKNVDKDASMIMRVLNEKFKLGVAGTTEEIPISNLKEAFGLQPAIAQPPTGVPFENFLRINNFELSIINFLKGRQGRYFTITQIAQGLKVNVPKIVSTIALLSERGEVSLQYKNSLKTYAYKEVTKEQ